MLEAADDCLILASNMHMILPARIAGITPDPAVDAYMKASALSGNKHSVTAEVGGLRIPTVLSIAEISRATLQRRHCMFSPAHTQVW
jgi:hypothetical protein